MSKSKRGRPTNPSADNRQNCQGNQRKQHYLWRFLREERAMRVCMIFVTVYMPLFGFFFSIAVRGVVIVQMWIIFGNVLALDFFFDLLVVTAIFAPECQRHQPRHIERSHSGSEKTNNPKNLAVAVREILTGTEGAEKNFVL